MRWSSITRTRAMYRGTNPRSSVTWRRRSDGSRASPRRTRWTQRFSLEPKKILPPCRQCPPWWSVRRMTSDHDRALLLTLAREAIAAYVGAGVAPLPPITGALAQLGGAFVTLRSDGELRGCIGHIEPTEPIGRVVPRCALAACSTDPRFPPVTRAELPHLAIEVSL